MLHTTKVQWIQVFFACSLLAGTMPLEVKEIYKWNYINYTWTHPIVYQYYVYTGLYIPENNLPSNIKVSGNRLYIALGRYYAGTPITLGYVKMDDKRMAPLVTPFPSWEMNVGTDCATLQNVNAFDIDENNVMWILDGLRHNNLTACSPKLVLFNMTSHRPLLSYDFAQDGDFRGAQMGDIVVDGNYAYITDSNEVDPGLIVYSRGEKRSWKLRDASMFPDPNGVQFTIDNAKYVYYQALGPITVSPSGKRNRFLFYSPISSLNIYKLNVRVVQDAAVSATNSWRAYVHLEGVKANQSSNYAMHHNGDLYFCLLNKNALAKWNIDKDFSKATFVPLNNMVDWCTGMSITDKHLYLLNGNIWNYLLTGTKPSYKKSLFRLTRVEIKSSKK